MQVEILHILKRLMSTLRQRFLFFVAPSTAHFRTLLFLPVNPIKEIRVAISISTLADFSGNPGLLKSVIVACPVRLLQVPGEPVTSNPQFHLS